MLQATQSTQSFELESINQINSKMNYFLTQNDLIMLNKEKYYFILFLLILHYTVQ